MKDTDDNIYIAGNFSECYHCDLPNGVFISKISPSGIVIWTDTVVSQPHYTKILIKNMFFKVDGSLSLSGFITDTINFMGFVLNRNASKTGFFAELDINGNCLIASILPYVPHAVVKNTDNSLSIAGQTTVPVSDLNYLPPSGNFIGNFIDYADANWIGDLPGTFDSSYKPGMTSSPHNAIYIVDQVGHISKHTSLSISNLGTSWYRVLEYKDNKLYGLSGAYWASGTLDIRDTNAVLLQQQTFGNSSARSFVKHAQGYAIGGMFIDSLVYNGQTYYSDTTGLNRLYILDVDSTWALQNFHIVKGVGYGAGGGLWPEFILSNGSDLFIQGHLGGGYAFGNDTIFGSCCGVSSYYYARLSLGIATNVNELKSEEDFSVYPNPSSGQYTILFKEKPNDAMIFVFDQSGKCILRQKISNSTTQQIDISKMAKGIYFIEVETGGERINKKIVLN